MLIAARSVGIIVFIVFMERSQRRLLILYPKRQMGNRMFGGETHLPAAEDQRLAGVIPPIFASVLLLMPATALNFIPITKLPVLGCSGLSRAFRPAAARPARLHGRLRPDDHLLLLLLHLGGVQSGGDGREPAQVRRHPAGHPAGQAHGRVHRLRAHPADRDRRGLHRRRLPVAGVRHRLVADDRQRTTTSAAPRS